MPIDNQILQDDMLHLGIEGVEVIDEKFAPEDEATHGLYRLLASFNGRTIVVFSHGRTIKSVTSCTPSNAEIIRCSLKGAEVTRSFRM